MIKKETFQFLQEIEDNNNKPWFEKNKARYLAAKEDVLQFISGLLPEIRKIEPIYEKDLKKYTDRIYRDLRFSKDKTPYKNSISSLIERAPDHKKCPFYIHFQNNNSFVAGGVWQPETELLRKVRQEIDYNGSEFNTIINKKSFCNKFGALSGDSLVRPPKGYEADHPNIELLKLKNYIVQRKFDNSEVTSKSFAKEILATYKEMIPFFNFFDTVKMEVS